MYDDKINRTIGFHRFFSTLSKMTVVALVVYGSKSATRISQVLDELNIHHYLVLPDEIPTIAYTHIILSGGPDHVYIKDEHLPEWVINSSVPVLGICYGMQLIAYHFGGTVKAMASKEKGYYNVCEIVTINRSISQSTKRRWMNRLDEVQTVPPQFHVTGINADDGIVAFTDHRKYWAVQYHPEHCEKGVSADTSVFTRFLET
jgi:GMP synthase (glutamine-hydrolysing)